MKKFVSVKDDKTPFDASKDEAGREQLANAHRQRAGFMKEGKLRVDAIRHRVRRSIVNDDLLDDDARALGAHIRQATEDHRAEQAATTRKISRAIRAAEEIGLTPPDSIRHPDRFARGIELWKESQVESTAEFMAAPCRTTQPEKSYVLDQAPDQRGAKPSANLYWALWAKVEKAKPGLSRHAITRNALALAGGPNPSPKDMTEAQLAKMIEVFSAILRDAKQPCP
jgi:hypothetical protein